MPQLLDALREKYATPSAVLRDLGLDEALLREGTKPMKEDAKEKAVKAALKELIAQDANLKDFSDFFDMLKAANPEAPAEEADEDEDGDEYNPDEADGDDMEENSAIPALAGEKAKDEDMDSMNPGGTDNEGAGNMNAEVAQLLMKAAKMLMGGGEPKPEAAPAIDAENPALEEKKEEEKKVDMKTAMDAAIAGERKRNRDLRDAERAVRPYVGELAIAFDSAEQVYRHTLKALGVEGIEKVKDASALPIILATQPKPGARKEVRDHVAMDAAAAGDFNKMFPDASRIKQL